MNITRLNQAPEYVAPNHFDMQCLRLQGREAGPAVQLWMGMSILKPGGHTSLDGSPIEWQGLLHVLADVNIACRSGSVPRIQGLGRGG